MKRILLALLVLSSLLLAACATTATAPNVSGVITKIDGNTVTVAAEGGTESTVTVGYSTRVFHPNGLEATGKSVLAVGQPVKVWLATGTQNASRINIG
jgi:hypothetical protein